MVSSSISVSQAMQVSSSYIRSWCGLWCNGWVQALVASGICATGLTICKGIGLLGILSSGCVSWVVYVGLVYV